MLKIDVHAHLYDQAYLEELGRILANPTNDVEAASLKQYQRTMTIPANWDIDERLDIMARIGLDYQVLSLSIPMCYDGDAAARLRQAQRTNDRFAEVVHKHRKHFFAFASLPLPDVEASLREMDRCLDELGFVGVGFGSNVRGMRLDHADFAPIFEEMNRRGTTAFLHPNSPTCAAPDLEEFNLMAGLAYMFDTGVTVYRMIYTGMLERYRRLKVIVPHLGGMLPFLAARIEGVYRSNPQFQTIPRPPGEYLKELYYDTVSFHPPALRLDYEMFGADHLMLGSDYPLGRASLEAAVQFVADFDDFSPGEREQVLSGNAIRVLGLRV
jgi:aminocarboxymuconate-semialdehyde decarboxylase